MDTETLNKELTSYASTHYGIWIMDWCFSHMATPSTIISYPMDVIRNAFNLPATKVPWNILYYLQRYSSLYYTITQLTQMMITGYVNGKTEAVRQCAEGLLLEINPKYPEFTPIIQDIYLMILELCKISHKERLEKIISSKMQDPKSKSETNKDENPDKSDSCNSNVDQEKTKKKKKKKNGRQRQKEKKEKMKKLKEQANSMESKITSLNNAHDKISTTEMTVEDYKSELKDQKRILEKIGEKIKINFNKLNFRYYFNKYMKIIINTEFSEFIRKNFRNYNIYKTIRIYQEIERLYNNLIKLRIYQENSQPPGNNIYSDPDRNYKYKRRRLRFMSQESIRVPTDDYFTPQETNANVLLLQLKTAIRLGQYLRVKEISLKPEFKNIEVETLKEIGYYKMMDEEPKN